MKIKHFHSILLILTLLLVYMDLTWRIDGNLSFAQIFGFQEGSDIFMQFRRPRVLSAIFTGAGLSLAGLIMQTLFRNPLAGPYLVGITPGATFGIAVLLFAQPILVHFELNNQFNILTASILGSLFALFLQLILNRGFESTTRLLLTGMVLSFLFAAGVDLLQNLGNIEQIKQFSLWGMGSFERVTPTEIPWLVLPGILGFAFVFWNRFKLDAYLLGDMYALSSGVNVKTLRRAMIWIGAIISGWITAFCGPVSFIGLIAPHVAKHLCKTESHQKILFPTVLWGIFLCVSADILAHELIEGITLQVNAISALIGAPILIMSFRKVRG
jgi:iron complex transport system permease protein